MINFFWLVTAQKQVSGRRLFFRVHGSSFVYTTGKKTKPLDEDYFKSGSMIAFTILRLLTFRRRFLPPFFSPISIARYLASGMVNLSSATTTVFCELALTSFRLPAVYRSFNSASCKA